MNLVFSTNNLHKLEEVRAVLGDAFNVLSLKEINCNDEIEETADSFEGNALLKAKYIFDHYHLPCFSDDSGLEVEVLNYTPGIYSARYAGEYGNHEKNIDKLLMELKDKENRKARFRTAICYVNEKGNASYFNGIINGEITLQRKGQNGFGYDPVFQPEGYNITFAQMPPSEKNKISHRALAVKELLKFLQNNGYTAL